jgi:hypothetical protein
MICSVSFFLQSEVALYSSITDSMISVSLGRKTELAGTRSKPPTTSHNQVIMQRLWSCRAAAGWGLVSSHVPSLDRRIGIPHVDGLGILPACFPRFPRPRPHTLSLNPAFVPDDAFKQSGDRL